jgi:microcystin-dependent protein
MSDPYIGEIRAFCFSFAPVNWAYCDGQSVDINQNPSLYCLLGTYYGGDGVNTFKLPNLQGRVAIHAGYGVGLTPRLLGGAIGVASVTLNEAQIPAHTHVLQADVAPNDVSANPADGFIATDGQTNLFKSAPGSMSETMNTNMVDSTGGHPHENRQPFLVTSYCIALDGNFPPRS